MQSLRVVARHRPVGSSAPLRRQAWARTQRRYAVLKKQEVQSGGARSKGADASGGTSSANSAYIGGLVGGGTVMLLGYSWYYFSGAKQAVNSISQTQKYVSQAAEKVKQKTPEPNQALQWLRETAQSYASFIPGARGYVDKAFDDLDRVRDKHEGEVDEIVSNTYQKLHKVAKEKGASLEGAYEAWSELEKAIEQISSLAVDAGKQILDNHPELKQRFGDSFESLQSLGDQYGPEAKKQVKETFDEVRQIFSEGSTTQAIQRAQQLVQDRTAAIRKKADELWQKGLQQAQPYLDKNPKIKELVENNKDALRQGNLSHLWAQVKNAADTGSTQDLEKFVQHAKEQAKSSVGGGKGGGSSRDGSSFSSILQSVTEGPDVMSKVQALTNITQQQGKEAEDLLKSTVDELKDVLSRKAQEAEKLASKPSG